MTEKNKKSKRHEAMIEWIYLELKRKHVEYYKLIAGYQGISERAIRMIKNNQRIDQRQIKLEEIIGDAEQKK